MYKLYFDGASRSNPGPASYGVTLIDPNGQEIDTDKKYIVYCLSILYIG